jgi:hypothetical protein
MVEILPRNRDDVVGLKVSGKLTDKEYKEMLIPKLETAVKAYGKIRFLCHRGNRAIPERDTP